MNFREHFQDNDIKESRYDLKVTSSEIFEADTRANLDIQVYTAKKYPRNLKQVLDNVLFLATHDKETAESCFYTLKRDGKTIRGASIRLAEIISSCYGNLRASARIVANDGRMLTAQGVCWDLENNVAYSIEVKRKITNKDGETYTEDMQVITANAACSIALRNAIFKVVPLGITHAIQNKIKDVILGNEKDFTSLRATAVQYFVDKGVELRDILKIFDKKAIEDLSKEDVLDLRGIAVAIKENETTLELAFNVPNKKSGMGRIYKSLNEKTDLPFIDPDFYPKPVILNENESSDAKNPNEPDTIPENKEPNKVDSKKDEGEVDFSLNKVYDIEFANGKKTFTEKVDSETFNLLQEKYASAIVKIDGVHPSEFNMLKEVVQVEDKNEVVSEFNLESVSELVPDINTEEKEAQQMPQHENENKEEQKQTEEVIETDLSVLFNNTTTESNTEQLDTVEENKETISTETKKRGRKPKNNNTDENGSN